MARNCRGDSSSGDLGRRSVRLPMAATALLVLSASTASAQRQSLGTPTTTPPPATESPYWVRSTEDFDSPQAKARAEVAKKQKAAEVEMRKIRHKYLGSVRVASIRQEGIAKLLAFNDPLNYPALIEVIKGEGDDVRTAMMEMFAGETHDAANIALATMAVNDASPAMRSDAGAKLRERLGESGFRGVASPGVGAVVRHALESGREAEMEAAAELAQTLHMYEAIAWLIPAQLGQAGGSGDGNGGDRGWIAIGLIAMSTEATGQSTQAFAWDIPAWEQWYKTEFYPLAVRRHAQAVSRGNPSPSGGGIAPGEPEEKPEHK